MNALTFGNIFVIVKVLIMMPEKSSGKDLHFFV